MYTKSDLKQFKRRGIKPEQIENQLENFKQGFDFVQIRDAATINNGIHGLNDEQANEFIRIFEDRMNSLKIVKMVPASGSASRMFKTLNTFFNTYTGSDEDYLKFRQDKEPGSIFSFFEKLKEFPFYPHLKEALYKDRLDLDKLLWKNQLLEILEYILTPKGLNYNATPKGLIDFHIYSDHIRTAAEEHSYTFHSIRRTYRQIQGPHEICSQKLPERIQLEIRHHVFCSIACNRHSES